MKLEQILEGAIGQRGRFTGYKPPNEKGEIKKDATYEYCPIGTFIFQEKKLLEYHQ